MVQSESIHKISLTHLLKCKSYLECYNQLGTTFVNFYTDCFNYPIFLKLSVGFNLSLDKKWKLNII